MSKYMIIRNNEKIEHYFPSFDEAKVAAQPYLSNNIAVSIEGTGAQDKAAYVCILDSGKTPPPGLIYRRLEGPITITK